MAAQAVLIAETIAGMKKAISRRDDESDSDESINHPSNRGNKLKRKARYVHEGQLNLPNGPSVYRRKIEHAGYERHIINRNPPRIDEDGDELEDDDVDEQADADAAEENPYGGIKLEFLLAPLTTAAELVSHPSLSTPYISNTLSEITEQASQMLHREKESLWRMKQLLTRFRGDETWIPLGKLETEKDLSLFRSTRPFPGEDAATSVILGEAVERLEGRHSTPRSDEKGHDGDTVNDKEVDPRKTVANDDDSVGPEAKVDEHNEPAKEDASLIKASEAPPSEDTAMADAPNDASLDEGQTDSAKEKTPQAKADETVKELNQNSTLKTTSTTAPSNADAESEIGIRTEDRDANAYENQHLVHAQNDTDMNGTEGGITAGGAEEEDEDSQPAPHRMTTRAQAQAASDNATSSRTRSSSPASSESPMIHPLFTVPPTALPDRDFGLPPAEAEDTRRLLLLYVQKQEEVCRGAEKLYDGLLKADRMRKKVLHWTKADAHVGEMSDGEDWYDKEEWGLEEDLKKGHEEEEDDTANQGKKTRGRRN
ncbi:MAG: hypothetical protein M1819_000113 [Sarea resinae]|nr:MAG: hypothetical protein M1819_000113 [Sarea resinae]